MAKWFSRAAIAVVLVAAFVALLPSLQAPEQTFAQPTDVPAVGTIPVLEAPAAIVPPAIVDREVPPSAATIQLSYAPIVRQAAPAVVNVYALTLPQRADANDPFAQFFQQFSPSYGRAEQSLGSGVIVDASGIVVTNVHVVDGADEIRVALTDGRELSATLLLADSASDLAILRLDGAGPFPALPVGRSEALQVGDLVLAIGNPFGVGQTVTSGIVSGLARTVSSGGEPRFFIQTDAAINPGNSGGALIDMNGRLVGINTAIYSSSGGSDGIGFATPAELVEVVAAAAEAGTRVQRPWTGARFTELTAEAVQQLGLDRSRGALVSTVAAGSPAADAGLRAGDVVVSVGGAAVDDPTALSYRLAVAGLGETTTLGIVRGGRSVEAALALTVPPETVPRDQIEIGGTAPFTGAVVVNLSPAVAAEIDYPGDPTGVAVLGVTAGSTADRIGLRRGDVVRAVNDVAIDDTRELDALAARGNIRVWQLDIERDGRIIRSVFTG